MTITLDQLIVWLIIGALVGSLVGRLIKGRKRGFGFIGNLALGLVGAVVGGILFQALDITICSQLQITATDLISAFFWALVVLIIIGLIQRR